MKIPASSFVLWMSGGTDKWKPSSSPARISSRFWTARNIDVKKYANHDIRLTVPEDRICNDVAVLNQTDRLITIPLSPYRMATLVFTPNAENALSHKDINQIIRILNMMRPTVLDDAQAIHQLLLEGRTQNEIAQMLDIPRTTLQRRMKKNRESKPAP